MEKSKLGDKIYEIRKNQGLSQEELGYRLGVSRQTISQWEANLAQPKLDKLNNICKVFGVHIEYFLSQDDTHNKENIQDSGKCATTIVENLPQENVFAQLQTSECALVDNGEDFQPLDNLHNNSLEQVDANNNLKVADRQESQFDEHFLRKAKITIAASVLALFVSAVIVVLGFLHTPPKHGITSATSITFNFGIESLSWLFFIIVAIVVISVVLLLIIEYVMRKKHKC